MPRTHILALLLSTRLTSDVMCTRCERLVSYTVYGCILTGVRHQTVTGMSVPVVSKNLNSMVGACKRRYMTVQ